MKKIILTTLMLATLTTSSVADVRPYIGASINSFSIAASSLTANDSSGNILFTVPGETSDGGLTVGIVGGLLISDNVKLNVSYYSGEESDSSIMTATVSSVSIDYSFNGAGVHRGWFLGAGGSNIEIETERLPGITASNASSASGLLVRGGYEYDLKDSMYLEIGLNLHMAEVEQSLQIEGITNGTSFDAALDVVDIQLSLSYIF